MKTILKTYGAVALGGLLLTGCGSKPTETQQQPTPPTVPTVNTFPVDFSRRVTTVSLPGDLKPYDEAQLFAKVNAYVKALYADRGTVVRKGQRLALLEAPELAAQLARARSQGQVARANYVTAKTNFERLERTSQADAGTISLNDLDRARGAMQAAEATLQATQSEIQAAQQLNQYLVVTAPFDGVISTRNVSVGALVGAGGGTGGKPLFELENGRRLRLVVAIPEKYTGQLIAPRTRVPFTVQAYPGETFTAIFKRKAGAMQNDTRAELIEMDVDNADNRLQSGMYANIAFAMQPRQATAAVPVTGVVNRASQAFVVRVAGGRAEWVAVSRGRLLTNDSVEIFGPIQAGDRLVARPTEQLKDGQPVRVVATDGAPKGKQVAAVRP
ncbi:efflux RND transporter periplasmic adaptor subunit [Fibrella sp. HMF5335]|uniref:Efflux RND transporter periplasmic adaptor subunit n=1 Tax=Fibrella rubiginis TaxID=2817060 RepID=A0A939GKX8_9BACT|nr:efflux RND transporter periplasmic adaptor subunit [Fibrella rubiginis]MBO0939320.1 efflux RND transporter periplasmic adaptor subunit [Fibrella rubiginis]